MIQHLIHIIWNQRKQNAWIWLELVLVIVCLWYTTLSLYNNYHRYSEPLGFDITHTYRLEVAERSADAEGYISAPGEQKTGSSLLKLMDRIRRMEGVEAVSFSIASHPYNSMSNYLQAYVDTTATRLLWYRVSDSFFDVFRIKASNGSSLRGKLTESSVILTQDAINKMFPANADATRKVIHMEGSHEDVRIAAVSTPVSYGEFFGCVPSVYTLFSDNYIENGINPGNINMAEVCIRVSANADRNDYADRFLELANNSIHADNLYIKDIRPVEYMRYDLISSGVKRMRMNTLLGGFLLISVFLGITGTFLFRTRQRRSELALRVTMGSSRNKLLYFLFQEGFILLALALIPAFIIAWNIFFATDGMVGAGTSFGFAEEERGVIIRASRFFIALSFSVGLIAVMMIAGIILPALRAVKMQPAEALHDE
jgi:putative ABC transport system permease protein